MRDAVARGRRWRTQDVNLVVRDTDTSRIIQATAGAGPALRLDDLVGRREDVGGRDISAVATVLTQAIHEVRVVILLDDGVGAGYGRRTRARGLGERRRMEVARVGNEVGDDLSGGRPVFERPLRGESALRPAYYGDVAVVRDSGDVVDGVRDVFLWRND